MSTQGSFVIKVRESTRGAAGVATVLWSLAISASLFFIPANIARSTFEFIAVFSTIGLGAYLGWRRRMGVIFFAPLVSWMFGWFPLIIGMMVRDGFFSGFFWGVLLATVGWVAIGAAEFLSLFVVAMPFRVVSGMVHHDSKITIELPFRGD